MKEKTDGQLDNKTIGATFKNIADEDSLHYYKMNSWVPLQESSSLTSFSISAPFPIIRSQEPILKP